MLGDDVINRHGMLTFFLGGGGVIKKKVMDGSRVGWFRIFVSLLLLF